MTNAVNIAQGGSNNVTMRNRIINGAMVVNQRNTAVSTSDTYTVDRWQLVRSSDATESVAQNTDAPAGFTYSLRDTISVGDASIAATQFSGFKQPIEGYNIADLGFGTANAQSVTVSFWVRSSVTGQYTGNIANSGYTRMCPFNFTINTANTWEQKTNTFPGDTSGTWLTTNGIGMNLQIYSALGSTYASGTANTWGSSGSNFGCGSPVNGIASNGNIFAISGVQLEKGSTATSFDYRPYGTELQLCQRYYENNYPTGYAVGSAANYPYNNGQFVNGYTSSFGQKFQTANFFVQKRTAQPTNTYYDAAGNSGKISTLDSGGTDTNNVSIGVTWLSDKSIGCGPSSGTMTGYRYFWVCSAEL
jgi:hypothetical protein